MDRARRSLLRRHTCVELSPESEALSVHERAIIAMRVAEQGPSLDWPEVQHGDNRT